jgi:hypothetical protein
MKLARSLAIATLFAGLAASAQAQVATTYHYGVKFVCGIETKIPDKYVAIGRYLTEINIGNPFKEDVKIEKYVNIVLIGSDKAIREPELAPPGPPVSFAMTPLTATSDDCAAIGKMIGIAGLGQGRVTIGFLNIISDHELNVTAVYTTQAARPTLDYVPGIAVEKIWPVKIAR